MPQFLNLRDLPMGILIRSTGSFQKGGWGLQLGRFFLYPAWKPQISILSLPDSYRKTPPTLWSVTSLYLFPSRCHWPSDLHPTYFPQTPNQLGLHCVKLNRPHHKGLPKLTLFTKTHQDRRNTKLQRWPLVKRTSISPPFPALKTLEMLRLFEASLTEAKSRTIGRN